MDDVVWWIFTCKLEAEGDTQASTRSNMCLETSSIRVSQSNGSFIEEDDFDDDDDDEEEDCAEGSMINDEQVDEGGEGRGTRLLRIGEAPRVAD